MIKFKNRTWKLLVTRNLSFFHSCLDAYANVICLPKFGLPSNFQLFVSKGGRFTTIFTEEGAKIRYRKTLEGICLNKKKLKKLEAVYAKYGNNLWRASLELEKKCNIKNYDNFLKAYRKFAPGLALTVHIGRHILELLIESLRKYYPNKTKQEIEFIAGELTYPDMSTPLVESQLFLLKIGEEMQKKKNKKPDVEKMDLFLRKYAFIPVNFNEESWTEKEIMDQLNNLLKLDCGAERKKILNIHKKKIEKSKKMLREIKDKKIIAAAEALKAGTYLNEYRKYIFCRASLAYRPLFREIAKKYGLKDWRECWKLTPQEVRDLYFKNKKEVVNNIKSRNYAGVMSEKNKDGFLLLDKKDLKIFIKEINKKAPKEKKSGGTEVSGFIANKGIVRAHAKIIMGKADFHKFNDGDVIVASMTSVDYVPLMKRASAFVTDEGGITSHASIVSRELGKPCIIGTKIATKLLKDGDLVEVDADRGIVKIIKNKK